MRAQNATPRDESTVPKMKNWSSASLSTRGLSRENGKGQYGLQNPTNLCWSDLWLFLPLTKCIKFLPAPPMEANHHRQNPGTSSPMRSLPITRSSPGRRRDQSNRTEPAFSAQVDLFPTFQKRSEVHAFPRDFCRDPRSNHCFPQPLPSYSPTSRSSFSIARFMAPRFLQMSYSDRQFGKLPRQPRSPTSKLRDLNRKQAIW
jgi:hypothetical protein